MNAQTLTQLLGGRWQRQYGTAPCPVCQHERRRDQTALTLANGANGRLLAHCKKSDCAFQDILAAAGVTAGQYRAPDPSTFSRRDEETKHEADRKSRQAQTCWSEALPIIGTPAERYLRGRGITCSLPSTLRYHPNCWHSSGKRFAAMVSLIEGVGGYAVHRTYLRANGMGKAEVQPNKAMLGATAGGAVRLTEAQGTLVVAEGIETALSLACGLLGHRATIWAALSTSGMRGLRLPLSRGRLTVATDGDDPGRAAGHDLAERAHALGWTVSLLPAPDGCDWCDVLSGKAVMV